VVHIARYQLSIQHRNLDNGFLLQMPYFLCYNAHGIMKRFVDNRFHAANWRETGR